MWLEHAEEDVIALAVNDRRHDALRDIDMAAGGDGGRRLVDGVDAWLLRRALAVLGRDEGEFASVGRGQRRQGIRVDVSGALAAVPPPLPTAESMAYTTGRG